MELPKTQQQLHKQEHQQQEEHPQLAKRAVLHAESDRIRINADDQTKCKLICYAITIVLFIIVVSLIAFLACNNLLHTVPQSTMILTPDQGLSGTYIANCDTPLGLVHNLINCNTTTNSTTLVAGQTVNNLSQLNQFLIFYLTIPNHNFPTLNEQVTFTLYSTNREYIKGEVQISTNYQITQFTTTLNSESQDSRGRYFVSFVNKLTTADQFYWQLTFPNTTVLNSTALNATSFELQVRYNTIQSMVVNKQFTLFTIILRVVFFAISVAVLVAYNRLILKLPRDRVSIEQRLIQLLSAVTLTFNDQFYFISVIYPNPISSFVSSFFIWNFVFVLFLIWVFFLSRIRHEQHEVGYTSLATKPKVIILVVFYAILLAYTTAYAISQTADHPFFSPSTLHSPPLSGLKALAYVAFALAAVYVIYLYITIFSRKPHRMWRSSIFMYLSLFFFIATTIFFFTGGYNIFDYSAAKIMFYITFMNGYSYWLQYLYAPTKQEVRRCQRGQFYRSENEQLLDVPQEDAVDVNVELPQDSNKSNQSQHDSEESKNSGKRPSSVRKHKKELRKQRNSPKNLHEEDAKAYNQFDGKSDGFDQM